MVRSCRVQIRSIGQKTAPASKTRAGAAAGGGGFCRRILQVWEASWRNGQNPPKPRTLQFTQTPLARRLFVFSALLSFALFFFLQTIVGCGTPEGRKPQALAAAAAAASNEPYIGRDEAMEGANGVGESESERKPLSEVVGDCVQRWFQDAYKEARKGDIANQVLVAQMFFSGYGTPKNEYKV
jgi:hypothetical protein